MTIELIDLDTGATMEVHGDKTSGLQFEGKPTERALRAREALTLFKKYEEEYYGTEEDEAFTWLEFIMKYGGEVELALKKMAKEKTQ